NYGVALNHAEQSPTPYTFAALGYGAVPTALTVKALNMGNTAATFNIELSGTNKDFFTLSAVSMGSVSPAEMGEFTVVPNTGLEIGTYTATVTVSIDGQDASYNKTFDVSFKVEKKNITVTGGTITTKTYDGTTDVTVTGVSFSGLENSDTLVIDTDYEITSAAFTDANAGSANRIVEMTVALKSTAKTNNYNLTNGTNYQLTGQTIAKATLTPDDLIIDPDTFARYTDEPQGIDLPTLKPPRTGLGAVTVKYDGSPWPPIYPGTYVITLDITEGENYDAVTDLPVGTYIIIEPPTPSLPRRVTLNVSSHFASDPQPGVFVVSDRKLVITLTPLPTLPAGYEPKVTTNRSPYPNDTGGVKITRNDDGTWTVHIAYILEGMEVIAEAVDPISANGDISASARVWSHGSWLYVAAGANDGRAYIYNISGVLVKTLPYTAGETVFTTLPAGIYVIAADGRQYKVAVKN
ncbi:MAG: YDG domain-containing protein, partial [Tannerella sp.]|nr:YDG domain-containing protein [Tannerella sp.]